jgi:aspartate racemase
MKTIGILGGMSWQSTHHYYQIMNEYLYEKLGGLTSIEAILYSLDLQKVMNHIQDSDWGGVAKILVDAAKKIEKAGAQFLIIPCNTVHIVASPVQSSIHIPLLHIVDPTAAAVKQAKIKTVGILGTKYTMELDFYRERLEDKHNIKVIIPNEADREIVNHIIHHELFFGIIKKESKREYMRIIRKMCKEGAQGVILGCTEISLLVDPKKSRIPLFDTTELHAKAAIDFSIRD